MPRYRVAYIDPKTGRERLGTGGDAQFYCTYANPKNVIRFGIERMIGCPPGQYNIYLSPPGNYSPDAEIKVMTAYKTVGQRKTDPYCKHCRELVAQARMTMNWLFPSHDPSPRCQSGKRTHCSCDICF